MYLFEDLMEEFNGLLEINGGEKYRKIPVDILEVEDGYQVIAEMPGVEKSNIKLEFEKGILLIEGKTKVSNGDLLLNERRVITFKRKLDFGSINDERISAKYENGLLFVDIVVKKEEPLKKNIIIE